jgi:hypothetical protein
MSEGRFTVDRFGIGQGTTLQIMLGAKDSSQFTKYILRDARWDYGGALTAVSFVGAHVFVPVLPTYPHLGNEQRQG